jgi:hypothetical protein
MKPILQAGVLLDEAYAAGNVDSALQYLQVASLGITALVPPGCSDGFLEIHSGYLRFFTLYAERIMLDLEGDSEGADGKYREAVAAIQDWTQNSVSLSLKQRRTQECRNHNLL